MRLPVGPDLHPRPSETAKANSDKLKATGQGLAKRDLLLPVLGVTFFIVLGVALAQANNWLIRWIGKTPYPDELRLWAVLSEFAAAFLLALIMNSRVSVNTFSLHGMYRSRLVRSYLGASNNKRRQSVYQFRCKRQSGPRQGSGARQTRGR